MNHAKISLCKADRSFLGSLTGLKEDTCNLTKNVTSPWELTFEVERYIDNNGVLTQSDYYDSIDEMMKLYLDTEDEQIFFVIDSEPEVHGEGSQEVKTVTARSEESELSNMFLNNFKINCGTNDSQEYLATDDTGNYNNIDPYTGLPIEYISLVNYENKQLSLLHLVLQNTGWNVEENIDLEVCGLRGSFDVSNNNIYSFLMNDVSPSFSIIFEFDRKHKQISVVKINDYGEDTGIFITMRNLMNSFDVSSSSDDGIVTKLVPVGANNLGIEYVNFGTNYIINLDYFMNTLNEYGDYKYVSSELHDKYNLWKKYRDSDIVEYNSNEYTRRELYAELTRLYNRTILDMSELKNRVPNDGTIIDYKTYSYDDLKLSLTAYNNALDALITLYKNEYGVTDLGESPDYLPVPSSATNIKDTPYWFDFYAYKEKIIPQVTESLKMYCQTDSNGNLMLDSNGEYIKLEFGNPDYYSDENIIKNIDSYLYEWSLYGLDELESKKKAWSEAANILFNECFIKSGSATSPTAYLTADDAGWNSLTQEQKGQFTTQKAFIDKLNSYLDYMSFDIRENSLTRTKCKGIIRQCEDAIKVRNDEILSLKRIQESYNTQRAQLSSDVALNKFFSDKEMYVINSMLHESEYKNENIVITSLDDIVSTVDAQEALYQAAVEELYKLSQPQYDFKTQIDNIYALEEFKSYQKPFMIGNFIRVGLETHEELFDNNFIKLRLVSITYNPILFDENMSIEFSTMTLSVNGITDFKFLLDSENTSSTSNSSGSSSSSSNGTYGNNDANVQISNNMLNALLSTELFGTTVNDVILDSIKANKGNFNLLLSHSGIFDSLEAGMIKVSGDCLFDHIKSSNYVNGKSGSILNLIDGSFSFAAGALTYDSKNGLSIKGFASESSIKTILDGLALGTTSVNGGCISTGNIKSNNYNGTPTNPIGNSQGSIIQLLDGKFNFGGGKLKWDGEKLDIDGNGKFTGDITASTINGSKIISENDTGKTVIDSGIIDIGMQPISQYDNTILDDINASITINSKFSDSYGYSFSKMTSNAFIVKHQNFLGQYDEPISSMDYSKSCIVTDDNITISDITGNTRSSYFFNGYCKVSASGITGAFYDKDDETFLLSDKYELGKNLKCKGAYQQNSFSNLSKRTLYVGSNGTISAASSSARYKQDISSILDESLNPNRIYDLPVCQFRYNAENGGGDNSQLYIGFIAEDVAKHYPLAARWNEDHTEVDTWEIADIFPAALKLIQDQHKEIEAMKEQFHELKESLEELHGTK